MIKCECMCVFLGTGTYTKKETFCLENFIKELKNTSYSINIW